MNILVTDLWDIELCVTGTNFADDAAVISGLESESQILLNLFSRWCSWADMIIRVDNCHSFGIKKSGTSSDQFQPKIICQQWTYLPVKQDYFTLSEEYFTYLGRHLDYKMTNNKHKDDSDTKDIMKKMDDLSLHPKNKMLICQCYVLSKLSWNLTIANIDITWVKQFLDSIVNQYVRSWPEILIAGTLDIIQLSKRKFGLCYVMVSATKCQTVIRNNLRKSSNNDMVTIYYDTNCDTIFQYDQFKSTK